MSTVQPAPLAASWASIEGVPWPLGMTDIPAEDAYKFALYSKYANAVTLLLYSAAGVAHPVDRYVFRFPQNKTGRVWHCRLSAARVEKASYYAYQVDGVVDISAGQRFDRDKILHDPYARAIYFPPGH